MNWGKWIFVSFVLFAGFIGTLVTVCVRQDISLVSKDYYNEELDYERQMVRIANVSNLISKPTISLVGNDSLRIVFDRFSEIEKGDLKLFRPSDSAMDKKFDLMPSASSTPLFSVKVLKSGMYRARMQWTMKEKEFFLEEVIYL